MPRRGRFPLLPRHCALRLRPLLVVLILAAAADCRERAPGAAPAEAARGSTTVLGAAEPPIADSATRAVAGALEELLWNQSAPEGMPRAHWTALQHLYDGRHYRPLWPRDSSRVAELLDSLCRPGRAGLAGALRPSAIPIAGGFAAPDTARIAARRDIALTAALLAHLDALAHGEVSPDSTGAEWHAPPPEALGDSALAAGAELAFRAGLAAAEAGLRPGSAAYLPLASRVAPLLGDTAPAPLVLSDSATLRAGRRDSAVVALRARLVADGDLDTSRAGGALYDAAVVRAVRRFQERHGLMPTGVVDPATRAALAESPRSRALTVMANLERYRWLPRRPEPGTLVADLGEGSLALFGGTDEPLRLALVTVPGGSCGAPLVADSVVAVRGDSARLRLTLRSGDSVVIASARGRRAAPQCLVAPELGRLTSALAGTAGPMLRRVVVVRPTARVGDDGSLRFAPDSSGSDARLRVALAARGDTLPAPVCAAPRRP